MLHPVLRVGERECRQGNVWADPVVPRQRLPIWEILCWAEMARPQRLC